MEKKNHIQPYEPKRENVHDVYIIKYKNLATEPNGLRIHVTSAQSKPERGRYGERHVGFRQGRAGSVCKAGYKPKKQREGEKKRDEAGDKE